MGRAGIEREGKDYMDCHRHPLTGASWGEDLQENLPRYLGVTLNIRDQSLGLTSFVKFVQHYPMWEKDLREQARGTGGWERIQTRLISRSVLSAMMVMPRFLVSLERPTGNSRRNKHPSLYLQ